MVEELQYTMFNQHSLILGILLGVLIIIFIILVYLININNKIQKLNDNIKYLNLKIDEKDNFIDDIINKFCNIVVKSKDKC